MGYAMASSRCFGCGQIFSYNPIKVPSIRHEGAREPICQTCVMIANQKRKEKGFDPIVPHPDAYKPCDESELGG